VPAAHGRVKEESELGDVVDLGQEVDLQDDFHEVVVDLPVPIIFGSVSLRRDHIVNEISITVEIKFKQVMKVKWDGS